MKENSLLILVIGMVIMVALAMPSLFNAGSNFLAGLQDFIRTGFDSTNIAQTAHLSFDIYYTDGSKRTFSPDAFSLLPLSISDEGGEISRIDISLVVAMTYEGTITQWSCESLVLAHIKQGTINKVSEFRSWIIEKQGTQWNIETMQLAKKSITAQELETATSPFGEGTYNLQILFDLTMIVNFSDGTRQPKGASAVPATWTYEYSTGGTEPAGAINSLNVQIGIARLRP